MVGEDEVGKWTCYWFWTGGSGFYLLSDSKEEVLEGFDSVQQLVPNL